MALHPSLAALPPEPTPTRPLSKPWWRLLYAQVLIAMLLGVALGHWDAASALDMKPLGDGFIKLIKMIVALVIFCTVVSGIAGMKDMRKMGRVGAKALLYFEVVSSLALVLGLLVANITKPGAGLNAQAGALDGKAVAAYAGAAKQQSISEFLLNIIPNTVVDAFAKGDVLPVLLVAVLFGLALARAGERCKPLLDGLDALSQVVFGMVHMVMRFAPIGAFGSMAFTVGKYGVVALGPLAKLIGVFYLTSFLFVFFVLGAICRVCGFSIWKFLLHIKEEILIVLGTSSSDTALPTLMVKLERLGISRPLVGLVLPTGYTFNTDGTSIYMTLAALFVAQAMNVDLSVTQQLAILSVALLTSKGASGVQGAAFIALVGTLAVVPGIPVAGMALILGIDRFMSEARALVNMIGNGVATVVMARWEGELTRADLQALR